MDKKWTLPIDEATSSVPSHWALTFSDAVALYAQELWAIELNLPGAPDPVWNKAVIDAATCLEVRHLVREFARAFRNQHILSWSSQAYDAFVGGQDGNNEAFEDSLRALYPPLDIIASGPASVADKTGVVVLFYVPDALTSERQAQLFMSVADLNPSLERERNRPQDAGIWRQSRAYFRADAPGLMATPGLVTVGIRQMQGHEKPGKAMHVAADLGGGRTKLTAAQIAAREWLQSSLIFGALMSAALAITHPEQYALTRECLIRLARDHPDLETVLKIWPFSFNAIAVVSNRSTGEHRDRNSGDAVEYDGMASVGGDDDVAIEFKGIGFKGRYRSGTVVWTSCHTHLHSVSDSPHAERVAFAAYSKNSVHLDSKLSLPRAPTIALTTSLIMQQIMSRR